MKEWKLGWEDPLYLTISADHRLTKIDYTKDCIWEIDLGQLPPPAFRFQTNFGLRVRSFSLFPTFEENSHRIQSPLDFFSHPVLQEIYPNYLRFSYAPFQGIEVKHEFQIHNSSTALSRIVLKNQSIVPRQITIANFAILIPLSGKAGMGNETLDHQPYLTARIQDMQILYSLHPVPVFGKDVYPSLDYSISMQPDSNFEYTWMLSTLNSLESHQVAAQKKFSASWSAQVGRIQAQNQQSFLEISTGDKDWNTALHLSQVAASRLVLSPSEKFSYPSVVQTRQIDNGFSARGNGTDYDDSWRGFSLFQVVQLTEILHPGNSDLLKQLLKAFFDQQTPTGFIDWKQGPANQPGKFHAQPFLCYLTWIASGFGEDEKYCRDCFPKLMMYIDYWFSSETDKNQNGFPEWNHPIHSGDLNNPLFNRWISSSAYADISYTETPTMGTMIFNELKYLIKIAEKSGFTDRIASLADKQKNIVDLLDAVYDEASSIYRYRDMYYQNFIECIKISSWSGSIEKVINLSLQPSQRLLFHIKSGNDTTRSCVVKVFGSDMNQPHVNEEIKISPIYWINNSAWFVSQQCYSIIEKVEITGIQNEDKVDITSVNYAQEDISLFLPLWASIPNYHRAKNIIEKNICNPSRFLDLGGISIFPLSYLQSIGSLSELSIFWNNLLLYGLCNYGYYKEAAQIYQRMMDCCIIPQLKHKRAFLQTNTKGEPLSTSGKNQLSNLPSVRLFLWIAGIRFLSESQILISGINPFPWPITVKYQGLRIIRQKNKTTIAYSNAKPITLHGTETHRITIPRS